MIHFIVTQYPYTYTVQLKDLIEWNLNFHDHVHITNSVVKKEFNRKEYGTKPSLQPNPISRDNENLGREKVGNGQHFNHFPSTNNDWHDSISYLIG